MRLTIVPIALSLMLLLGGCERPDVPTIVQPIKAEQGQLDFFERPIALARARASGTPYPLIVLLESNPWRNVIGSDSPAFALYSDGTVIYRAGPGFKSTKLSPVKRDSLLRSFTTADLAKMAGHYRASNTSDQTSNELLIYGNGSPFYVSVYGALDDAGVRAKLPRAVLSAYARLREFGDARACDWWPERVEIMTSPYPRAPDVSIRWPNDWPGLRDPATVRRGDSYSIFMPSKTMPAVKAFLATRKDKGAVEIDGRKWAVNIRLPFPNEALWMAQNEEAGATR